METNLFSHARLNLPLHLLGFLLDFNIQVGYTVYTETI